MARKIREYTCQYCKKPFKSIYKDPRWCSSRCRKQLKCTKTTRTWQPEEIAVIEKMVGYYPLPDITRAVQRIDRKHGWKERTEFATKHQIEKMGLSYACLDDNLSSQALAEMLGVDPATVRRNWKKSGLIIGQNKARAAIRLKHFREWAKQNPEKLYGLNQEGLAWLLEDEEWARQLAESAMPRIGIGVKLKRLDTKQVFNSISQAEKHSHIGRGTLMNHWRKVKRNNQKRFTSVGIEWEVIINDRQAS